MARGGEDEGVGTRERECEGYLRPLAFPYSPQTFVSCYRGVS